MSLLLDALKKAEKDKEDSVISSLETTHLEEGISKAKNGEPLFLEEELQELELDSSFIYPQEAAKEKDDLVSNSEEKLSHTLTDAEPEPEELLRTDNGITTYGSKNHAKQVFVNKNLVKEQNSQTSLLWLILLVVALLIMGGLLWLYENLYDEPSIAQTGRLTEPVIANTKQKDKSLIPQADTDKQHGHSASVIAEPEKEPVLQEKIEKREKPSNPVEPSKPKPIHIVRITKKDILKQSIKEGYDLYYKGQYDAARVAYSQALQEDTNSRDALLGMGAISLREASKDPSKLDHAKEYYRRLLQLNPNDGAAQAGLLATDKQYSEGKSKAQLKEAIKQQPNAASLHYSLANRYAKEQNWNKAQQSYFIAHSLASHVPDYVFNLAVSLDHMGKQQVATQYYKKALELSSSYPHSIDIPQLEKRLLIISSMEGANG